MVKEYGPPFKEYQSNTPKFKILECYICGNRVIENSCRNCFIFTGNKFSSTNFRKQITHYIISQKNCIFPHITMVCNCSTRGLQISQDNR